MHHNITSLKSIISIVIYYLHSVPKLIIIIIIVFSAEECGSDTCASECDYRENANSRTFKRNTYCYGESIVP